MNNNSKFSVKWKDFVMKAEGISPKTWACIGFVFIAIRLPEIIKALGGL